MIWENMNLQGRVTATLLPIQPFSRETAIEEISPVAQQNFLLRGNWKENS